MKKLMTASLVSILCVFLIASCTKEAENELSTTTDQLQAMLDIEPTLPDLVISSISSSLPVTQGPCPGAPKADGTCNGGTTTFNFTIRLENRSPIAVPPNTTFDISWAQFGGPSLLQVISPATGVPGNGSILVTSPNFNLACPTGPPPYQLVTKQFYAIADFTNSINEFRENNNISDRYKICDDL